MIDPEGLDNIRTLLRERMDGWHLAGQPIPTLNCVRLEMSREGLAVDIAWRLSNGGEITLRHYCRRFFHGAPADLMGPVRRALIEMYREKFIELTGNHEAYVPDPAYQYAIIERELRVPNYNSIASVAEEMTMRTTRDPYHANQRDRGANAREEEEGRRRREAQRMMAVQNSRLALDGALTTNAAPDASTAFTIQHLHEAMQMMRAAPDMAVMERYAEENRRAEAAAIKGWSLLLENLTKEQRKDLGLHGYFWVVGGDTGISYRIKKGRSHNIYPYRTIRTILGGKRRFDANCSICFGPDGGLCIGDVMLTQKTALELRETEALLKANFSGSSLDWLKAAPGGPDIVRKIRDREYQQMMERPGNLRLNRVNHPYYL